MSEPGLVEIFRQLEQGSTNHNRLVQDQEVQSQDLTGPVSTKLRKSRTKSDRSTGGPWIPELENISKAIEREPGKVAPGNELGCLKSYYETRVAQLEPELELRQVSFQMVGKQRYRDRERGINSFDVELSKMKLILGTKKNTSPFLENTALKNMLPLEHLLKMVEQDWVKNISIVSFRRPGLRENNSSLRLVHIQAI